MKTIITTLIIISLGTSAFYLTYKQPPMVEISVLRDVTDKELSQPHTLEILPLYNLSGDGRWGGAIFRFSNLSDVSYNHISEVELESQNQWLSNEFSRDKEVTTFTDSVTNIINTQNETIGREHSSIYLPIANELNLLATSTAKKRILIVYSDLMENDLDFSLYSKNQLALVQSHPEYLSKILETREALNNLAGIKVYFIYQPDSSEQDNAFRIISGFYENLLESKGATVHIAANVVN